MKLKNTLITLAMLLVLALSARAQEDSTNQLLELNKILRSLKYQQGQIDIKNGLAKLSVPANFNYLGPDDAETVLVKLWGNLPGKRKPLGMLMPAGMTPISSNCWAVTIDYSDEGFVKDNDASKINYDDLLKQMQKGVQESNKVRKEKGYPTFDLLGWAAPPRYDAAAHKLYWAMKLKVEGAETDTLNYNIRILGRRGVLELNAISAIDQFPEIDQQTPQILSMVDYKEGNRYADFDPKVDKVAAFGVAGLVAGGLIAAKLGFFKVIWVALIAAKKFVIIGIAAAVAFIKKLFKRKDSTTGT